MPSFTAWGGTSFIRTELKKTNKILQNVSVRSLSLYLIQELRHHLREVQLKYCLIQIKVLRSLNKIEQRCSNLQPKGL